MEIRHKKGITHEQLVEAAKRWLWRKCSVVITEMAHGSGEEPDAIGWHDLRCILIECKASVADFRADELKHFRICPELGMGQLRYYCAPKGMLSPVVMPPAWGLLAWDGKRMEVVREANPVESNRRGEISLLLSALRRTGAFAPSGVSVKCYTIQTLCRATLGTAPEECQIPDTMDTRGRNPDTHGAVSPTVTHK